MTREEELERRKRELQASEGKPGLGDRVEGLKKRIAELEAGE